jgi:hypothetical protein
MTSISRIIDALFRDPDETVSAARVDIAYTEDGVMIEVGPHPGFSDGSMVVVLRQGPANDSCNYELEFQQHSDVRDARSLAAALNAWADWASEENNKRKDKS